MSYFYGGSFKGSSAPWWSKASDIVLGTLKGSICKHVRFYSKNKGSVIRRKIRKSRQSQRARCEIEGAFTEGCGCEWWNFVKWNGPKIMWLLLMLIFSTKPTSLAPNMTWNYYSLIQFLINELWNFLQGFFGYFCVIISLVIFFSCELLRPRLLVVQIIVSDIDSGPPRGNIINRKSGNYIMSCEVGLIIWYKL